LSVRIAVIGAGAWGLSVVRAVAATERAQLTWVCDRSAAALARFTRWRRTRG